MTTPDSPSDHLRALSRHSRIRVDHVQLLLAEQRIISAQSAARITESRLLLDRAFVRAQVLPTPVD
jgi:hypothetical protein